MIWDIVLTDNAIKSIKNISDRRIQKAIAHRIDKLSKEPDKQSKPLLGELAGYRSVRAAGQRYRIIFRLEKTDTRATIVMVGIRKDGGKRDIYELAKKLFNQGLLG